MTFKQNHTEPVTILFLVLPYGISSGFATVTLPFLLIQQDFSVAAAASITALGISANLWRFVWAPLTDLTLSLHKWYLIGISLCSVTLLLLCFIPINTKDTAVLIAVVLLSQIAATFVVAPVGGFMAKTVAEKKRPCRRLLPGRQFRRYWYRCRSRHLAFGTCFISLGRHCFINCHTVLCFSTVFCATSLFRKRKNT